MIISIVLSKISAWIKYRKTVRQLSELSDRELMDIGVERYDIKRVVRGAVFN